MSVPLSYNLRNLFVRKGTTFAAAGGIALVVFVFAAVLMLSNSIKQTLGRSGSEDVAIILRDGSDAELSSSIEEPQIGVITAAREVSTRSDGKPDATSEVVVVAAMEKLGADGVSNVTLRGIRDDVMAFRPSTRIVAGRAPNPGAEEAMVGVSVRGRFKGLDLGQAFEVRRNRAVAVVGVFEDGGSSFESEVWAPIDIIRTSFGREGLASSVRVRLQSATSFDAYKRAMESNRQLGVDVARETAFYEKQSEGTSIFITAMGVVIAFFFSIGAMIGAMITMYAAVANRMREIGTLRALGFSKMAILSSFLVEAILLSLLGGGVGVLASLCMGLVRFSMMNFTSWSEITFTFEPTPGILLGALCVSVAMGLFGGALPALRAARVGVLDALRG
jgi:putative ABC transport system permease protein